MDIKDFKSLILNAISKEPDVKSKIIKRVLKNFYPGYISSRWVSLSHKAQVAMKLLISENKIIFIPRQILKIK